MGGLGLDGVMNCFMEDFLKRLKGLFASTAYGQHLCMEVKHSA